MQYALKAPFLTTAFAALALAVLAPSAGHAGGPRTESCDTLGTRATGGAVFVELTVSEGDTVNWVSTQPLAQVRTTQGGISRVVTAIWPTSGSYTIPAGVSAITIWTANSPSVSTTFTCTTGGSGTASDAAATDAAATDAASQSSGNTQNNALADGTNKASNRLRGSSANNVAQNGVFFSTQGIAAQEVTDASRGLDTPGWNAWMSGDFRGYSGDSKGRSAAITLGADVNVGENALVGLAVSFERSNIDTSGSDVTSQSTAIAAYFAGRVAQNVYLDVFASSAQPKYKINGGSVTSRRTGFGLRVSGDMVSGGMALEPSVSILSYVEKTPAFTNDSGRVSSNTVRSTTGNLGLRISSAAKMSTGFNPFVDLGVDFNRRTSDASKDQSFSSGRFGFGFNSAFSNGGSLTMAIDAGRVLEGVNDVGLQIEYAISF